MGRRHGPGKHVILTVGTDCAIGKMTVALELRRAAVEAGLRGVFVPTGQTGIMIEGWGVSVDRVIADFINGTAEWLVEQAEARGDWIFVEGQGSLDHPAYSAVTLGLVHGTTPHAMVLVHQPGRSGHFGWEKTTGVASPTLSLQDNIRLYESVANAVAPSRVAAIALNTGLLDRAPGARRDRAGRGRDRPARRRPLPLRPPAAVRRAARDARRRPTMTFSLDTELLHLPFRDPFRIARNEDADASQTVLTMLQQDGASGTGECFPVPYYGETVETTMAVLPLLLDALDALGPLPQDRGEVLSWLERSSVLMTDVLGNHGGAKGGLDMALHDLAGKALGLPVWQLLGTSDRLPPTDYSLGIDDPATVAERARRVAHFPALEDQGRWARGHRDAGSGARGLQWTAASRRQHRLAATAGGGAHPRARPPGRGAGRAALQGTHAAGAALAAGALQPAHHGRRISRLRG